jgi:hypothetical protein
MNEDTQETKYPTYERISLRVDTELFEQLSELAIKELRSLNSEIIVLLREALTARSQ